MIKRLVLIIQDLTPFPLQWSEPQTHRPDSWAGLSAAKPNNELPAEKTRFYAIALSTFKASGSHLFFHKRMAGGRLGSRPQ